MSDNESPNELSSQPEAEHDIAVLFLDPQFRSRRFTPPAKELIELISTDIGRPSEICG